jgi:hypothetical protein
VTGAWVTWSGDVLTWPGVDDITPNLNQAVAAMPWRDDVDDARYDYTPGAPRVVFHILVRWGITEVVAKRQAIDALRACLPPAGIATPRDHIGPHTVATIHLEWWPDEFRWW